MILDIKNLTFSYGSKYIFKDINFKLESKDTLSILGPNGIGKTTGAKPQANAKATNAIAEAKANNEKIVVREARSLVDDPVETLDAETPTPIKKPVINDAKRQAL